MWVRAASAGLVLGVLAYAADFCHGNLAVLMLLVSSSVFAWGGAALVAGYTAAGRRTAIGAAVTVLAVATLVYYGVILADGDRWRSGTLEDGSSAASMGLRSILRATASWLAASIAGGTVLGLLAQAIRRSRPLAAALAAGGACALLAGPGVVRLIPLVRGELAPGYLPEIGPWLAEAAAEIGLAVVLSAVLLRHGARPWQWGWFALAAASLLTVALLGWTRVEAARPAVSSAVSTNLRRVHSIAALLPHRDRQELPAVPTTMDSCGSRQVAPDAETRTRPGAEPSAPG